MPMLFEFRRPSFGCIALPGVEVRWGLRGDHAIGYVLDNFGRVTLMAWAVATSARRVDRQALAGLQLARTLAEEGRAGTVLEATRGSSLAAGPTACRKAHSVHRSVDHK